MKEKEPKADSGSDLGETHSRFSDMVFLGGWELGEKEAIGQKNSDPFLQGWREPCVSHQRLCGQPPWRLHRDGWFLL